MSSRASTVDGVAAKPRRLRIPFLPRGVEVGLGDLIRTVLARLGIPTCRGCARRAEALNGLAVFAGPCQSYTGRCTGFGSRQCVTAPESLDPDAAVVEQCCGGWFQYPWIEICPGQSPRMGCGFCFW
jgi:hypothetical protein